MSNSNVNVNCSSGALLTLLTLLFVAAKLVGLIDWSWWWVFSPAIAGVVLSVAVFIFVGVVALIVALRQ